MIRIAPHKTLFRFLPVLGAGLLCSACMVGPDFHPPAAPGGAAFTATPLSAETGSVPCPGGEAQRFLPGRDIPPQWWTLFHAPVLDRLVTGALQDNPTLSAARATLRQAQEALNAEVGSALYPKVDAGASVTREKISGAAMGQPNAKFSPFTLYNASVNVSYALDLFGGARRELEALEAQVDLRRFELEGAYLTLTANVVTTAIREASLRAQSDALREIIAAQQEQYDLVKLQVRLGGASRADALAQQTQLAQTRAALPPLEYELVQTRHRLAVLSGKLPADSASLPGLTLDQLQLPADLPVSLPSSLVRQRPDIRAAEALLHAASAEIGVATAAQYPQVNLTGSLGSMTTSAGSLFSAGTGVWNIGAGVLQPIFHGGALSARRRAAEAAYDQALAQYRSVVLQSFQDVADVLRALDTDAILLKAQADADASARDSLQLTREQFRLGGVSYLALLNAERQYQQTRIGFIEAQARRYSDTAALFQALGGGWWNRDRK